MPDGVLVDLANAANVAHLEEIDLEHPEIPDVTKPATLRTPASVTRQRARSSGPPRRRDHRTAAAYARHGHVEEADHCPGAGDREADVGLVLRVRVADDVQ